VLRSLAPEVAVVDLTHDIPAHDVRAGALCLARAVQYLCPGVVLAVVDPGVGTDRRAIALEVGGGQSFLVGPDNGLLAPAVAMVGGADRAVALTNPEYQLRAPGPTFAGRDVFAPAAAHLCDGVPLYDLGDPVDPASLLPGVLPVTHLDGDELAAEVLWVDRYGNAQLNVDPDEIDDWGPRIRMRFGNGFGDGRTLVRARAYGDLAPGDVGLVVDSYGLLSVAIPRGSAAERLGLDAGDPVRLVRLEDADTAADESSGNGVTSPVQLRPRG
jgi:S-adenosyl-L-methionine hydrolase (adenosine-forming)